MKLPCLDCGKAHERSEDCVNGENRLMSSEELLPIRTAEIKIKEALAYMNEMNYSSHDLDTIRALLTEDNPLDLPERAKNWYQRYHSSK